MYNPRVRVESLLAGSISQAAAKQRAGRAGRTRPGKCYRLYTEKSFNEDLQKQTYPEVLRSKMDSVLLTLFKLNIKDVVHFDFMDPPAPDTMMRSFETLNYIGAIDDEGELTEDGERMSVLPLEPELAALLLLSCKEEFNCSVEMLIIVALLSSANIFMRPREAAKDADAAKEQFAQNESDHLTLLNAFYSFVESGKDKNWCYDNFLNFRSLTSALHVKDQLQRSLTRMGLPIVSADFNSNQYYNNLRKCLSAAGFMKVAHLQRDGHYLTVKDRQVVAIHPSSVIDFGHKPAWILFHEFVLTKRNYMRTCTIIQGEWLMHYAPHYYDLDTFPEGETKQELVRIKRRIIQEKEYRESKANNSSSNSNSNSNSSPERKKEKKEKKEKKQKKEHR